MSSVVSAIKSVEARGPGKKHVLKILCPLLGDDELEFDPGNMKEIEEVAKRFEAAQKDKGMIAFSVSGKGEAKQIREFDPEAQATVMTPPMSGG